MSDTYPKSADLTDQLVRRLPFTARGQVKIRDEECKGLLLVIGMETKTFSTKVERMVGGIRECGYETFGRFDPRAPDHVGALPPLDVTMLVEWNAEKRRRTGMGLGRLPAWGRQLAALENPVRREFHLMSLLSGSRPDALSKAEWSHVSVARRVLHIPAPKGGEERAFDIPLSRPMLYCLVRARRAGRILHREQAQRFIFPSVSQEGHLVDWREAREVLSKFGTDLRQSFKTMSVECGVGKLEAKILMNHKVDQDVHDGYATTPELREHLH
jgi:hypothetical protein